jgi:hypothetical protein
MAGALRHIEAQIGFLLGPPKQGQRTDLEPFDHDREVTNGLIGKDDATAIIADEASFWRSGDTSMNPAASIFAALRPSMSSMPGSMLLVATTPHSRRGIVYETYKKHWAKDDDSVLVWQADTRKMNSSISQAVVDAAYEDDPAAAASEYGGLFRSDLESYISPEVIDAVMIPHRHELPPVNGIHYSAFVDPSGGSGGDSMTLAIAHNDRVTGRSVIDAVRERRPPFSPADCVWEFAKILKAYGIHKVVGDRYAGEWPREAFRKSGAAYEPSERVKSEVYIEALPILNAHRVELLDHPKLVAQLLGLERRTSRGGGRDNIDHGPGGHDDIANAACGALVLVSTSSQMMSPDSMQKAVEQMSKYAFVKRRQAAMGFSPQMIQRIDAMGQRARGF